MKGAPPRLPQAASLPLEQIVELLDICSEGIVACDLRGAILSLNLQAEHLLGLSRKDAIGLQIQRDLEIFPPGSVDAWIALAERPGSSDTAEPSALTEMALEFVSLRGHHRTCQARVLGLRDLAGAPRGFAVFLRDASETALALESLADMREQFRTLMDHSSDVILQFRPDLLVQYANPALRTVTGFDPAEWVGRRLALPTLLPPEEIRRLRAIGTHRLFREGIRNKLFRIHRRDGSLFWGLLSIAPVRHGRSLRGLLAILRDVSEFYATREQLEFQHAQLKRTVAQLEESYRLQEQFVANVTHELRTPLTTILITSEVLEKGIGPHFTAAQRRQVQLVRKNSQLLLDIINDLLDLAKLKRDGFQVQEQEVFMAEFLGGVVDSVEPLFHQKKLFVKAHAPADAPRSFRSDPVMLRKILVNILGNACKFTEEGGAMIAVETDGSVLRFRVADTGIGIPPEHLATIFEEFRQIDGSDARSYAGTGLGLSIADRFAKLLGGRIEVESVPKQGSRFTVTIPLKAVLEPPPHGSPT